MIFLSDLDNTLIFSYKKLSPDNLCVEKKDGKELSYMTYKGAELFSEIVKKCTFIPITTRSTEQYERISFPNGFTPEYAVCCNGGHLLVNGVSDPEWRKIPEEIFRGSLGEINAVLDFLGKREEIYYPPKIIDGSFLFAKSHTPDKTLAAAAAAVPAVRTNRYKNGDKIYAVPVGMTKAAALLRLKERFGGIAAAAGDSLFDEDMLAAADIAVVKHGELSAKAVNKFQITEISGDDPDFVLTAVNLLLKELRL